MLGHLSAAVLAADHLGEVADHLIGHFVDQARRSGASWTEIGASMGVSKQAAQKRFVPKDVDMETVADIARVYNRYTLRARQVIVAAQESAFAAGSETIGTEHLLSGLLSQEEGIAALVIAKLGAPLGEVRAKVGAVIGPGTGAAPGKITIGAPVKKVLELTLREALRLGHNYVGTEHMLLALLEHGEGAGAEVLGQIGVAKADAEREIVAMLGCVLAEDGKKG